MALTGPTVMLTVELSLANATLAAARELLDLAPDEVDEEFGLVPVNPVKGTYAILVTATAGSRAHGVSGAAGPYANPRIEPFGPPQAGGY